jgi:hypothetical protein
VRELSEKGNPFEKDLPQEKAMFTMTAFVAYNMGAALYTPHIWKAFIFSVVLYLETTMVNNYLFCQTLIITNDIFLCGFAGFVLYHSRWMLT